LNFSLKLLFGVVLTLVKKLLFEGEKKIIISGYAITGDIMARVCRITGKKPMVGNRVSHANNKNKRRFLPSLHQKRFWVESEKRWLRVRLSSAAIRTIDKKGIENVMPELLNKKTV